MNKILQEEPDDNRFDIRDKRELERNRRELGSIMDRGKYNNNIISHSPSAAPTTLGSTSSQRWRGSDLVGDHTHIFWDCPNIPD